MPSLAARLYAECTVRGYRTPRVEVEESHSASGVQWRCSCWPGIHVSRSHRGVAELWRPTEAEAVTAVLAALRWEWTDE